MSRSRLTCIPLAMLVSMTAAASSQDQASTPNWPAPATWQPAGGSELTAPLQFVGLTPCRLIDTRGNGFTGAWGPPLLTAGVARNFPIAGQCQIPSDALAVSANLTVARTQAPGHISAWPQGGAQPVVSSLNYVGGGQMVANAAVITLGEDGGLTILAAVGSTDFVMDINGYYRQSGVTSLNGLMGNLDVIAGDNVSVSTSGNSIVINASTEPGPPGPTGPAGPAGPTGPQGDVGAAGPAGPTGPAGAQGDAGPVGPQGPAGAQGDTGAAGPAGPQGPAGTQGDTGPAGPAGPQGDAGPTGAQGPAGAQGDVGPTGAQGPAGAQGDVGPAGPAGTQGDAGPTGAQGPAGPQGDPGAQGATGPQGPAGPQGQTGAIGATGPQGPQGQTGATGATGAQGPQGQTGATGATGATGPQGPQGPAGPSGNSTIFLAPYNNPDNNEFLGFGTHLQSNTESTYSVALPAGTVSNLMVWAESAPGSGTTLRVRIRKNGANTNLTCTITGSATTCTDNSNTVSFNAFDIVSIQYTENNDPDIDLKVAVKYVGN